MSIIKLFTHNWQMKLTCLLLAVGFWTYVSSTSVKIGNFPGGVMLEMYNTPEGMIAISDTDKINLSLTAEKNIWSKLSSDSVKAYVDLAGFSAGTYEMNIKVETNITGVEVNDFSPKKVLIRLEPKAKKTVPVNVKIEGNAAEGLVPGTPIIEPEEVEINGAKSIIDKILEASAVIRLDGESEDVKKSVKLIALNAENENIPQVKFVPEEVSVNIPIIKAETTKTVGIKLATSGQVASGYWISNISINPPTVTITGSSSLLKSIIYIETKKFNVDNINKDISTNIELEIPSGISIVNQIKSINVNIIIAKVESSKQLNSKITSQNLASNLKLFSMDPENILVNIAADTQKLDNTSSNDIILKLDLSKYTKSGTYYVDVTNNMFELKEGISLLSFTPSSIKITLSDK